MRVPRVGMCVPGVGMCVPSVGMDLANVEQYLRKYYVVLYTHAN